MFRAFPFKKPKNSSFSVRLSTTQQYLCTLRHRISHLSARCFKHIPCSFLQSPGLKSDILGRNYLTYRQQPSASSHIFCSHARVIIPHKMDDCKHFARFIKFFICRILGLFTSSFCITCTNKFYTIVPSSRFGMFTRLGTLSTALRSVI